MKARDLMKTAVMTVGAEEELGLAAQMMAWAGIRHLPVMHEGKVVGVLSERDILEHQVEAGQREAMRDPVGEAMSAPPKVASPDDDLVELSARMASEKIGCLPLLDKGKLVGLITVTDMLAERVRRAFQPRPAGPTVGSVMTRNPLTVAPDDYLLDAAARMAERHVRHLPVVDGDRRVIGMISDRDVRTAIGDPRRALEEKDVQARVQVLRVSDAMARHAFTADVDSPLTQVVGWLVGERFGAIPVVDKEERLIGIVSYVDVLKKLGAGLR